MFRVFSISLVLVSLLNSETIENSEFETVAGGLGDPVNALLPISGFTKVGDSYISIRGSEGRESVAVLDYLPVGYLYHFYGNYSVLNPDIIESITLHKSNFSPQYGNSMGSLIELKTVKGDVGNSLRLNGYDSSIMLSGEVENISYLLSGRQSYLHKVFPENIEIRDRVEYREFPSFFDFALFLRAKLSSSSTISLESIGAGDSLKLYSSENSDTDPDAIGEIEENRGFRTFGLRWKYVGDLGETETLIYRNRESEELSIFDNRVDIDMTQDGIFHISKFRREGRQTSFGFEYINWKVPISMNSAFPKFLDDYSYLYSEQQKFQIEEDLDVAQTAIFLEDSFSIGTNWELLYGFRFIKDSYGIKDQNINPRFKISYQPESSSDKLTFSVGKYSQMVNGIKLIDEFGNPDLTYEQAIHYLFNYTKTFSKRAGLIVELYNKQLYNLSVRDEKYSFLSTGEGEIEGIDIDLYKRFERFSVRGAYSFISSKRAIDNKIQNRFYGEIPHSLKLLLKYQFNNSFVSLFTTYQSGRRYTSIAKSGDAIIYGEPFEENFSNYFQTDLKVGFSGENWKGSIEVLNLTDHKNIEKIIYSSDYVESRKIYGRSIMPWFSLEYRF